MGRKRSRKGNSIDCIDYITGIGNMHAYNRCIPCSAWVASWPLVSE